MNATMSAETSNEERLAAILEEYLADLQAGRAPSKSELFARNPDLADDLEICLGSLEYVGAAGIFSETAPQSAPADATPVSRVLGDFRILREIGRGGMGIVYEAQEISLNRRVALKVLPFAGVLDPRRLARFKTEAQAAAQLHHQGIVPVYHVGCERGVHYYAMQYVDGQTLAEVIAALKSEVGGQRSEVGEELVVSGQLSVAMRFPAADHGQLTTDKSQSEICNLKSEIDTRAIAGLSTHHSTDSKRYFQSVAKLGIQAAEALEYAHQSGIIHRDVKPGNLLVDSSGKLWITDFGLARVASDSNLTVSGDLLGTIRYMSPEQALSDQANVDHRTDVYSLGATLYELLTLEPLVAGEDRAEILRKIAVEEPRPPRRVNKKVPTELDTIVLKATSKIPRERYSTAQAMADDLRRFLDFQPIRARRPTIVGRVRKWTRRHRQVVTACLALLGLTLVTVGPFIAWRERSRATHQAAENYNLLIGRAKEAWDDNNVPYVLELLDQCEDAFRGFEWHWLRGLCEEAVQTKTITSEHMVTSMAASPNRKYLATCGADLLVPSGSAVTVWDLATHRAVRKLADDALCVAYSADGEKLLTGHLNAVRVWRAATGEELAPLTMPPGGIQLRTRVVKCSRDGKWIAAAGQPYRPVLLWSARGGQPRLLTDPSGVVKTNDIAFSPDGSMLVAAQGDGKLRRWSTETGEPIGEPLHAHSQSLAVAFSPSAKVMASGGADGSVIVWEAATGVRLKTLATVSASVTAISFLDEDRVAVGREDKTVVVWKWKADDTRNQDEEPVQDDHLRVRRGHAASVAGLAYLPNERRLVSGGKDGRILLWDADRAQQKHRVKVQMLDWGFRFVDFSRDSKTLSVAGTGDWRFWALPSLAEKPSLSKGASSVNYSPSPQKPLIATTHWDIDKRHFFVRIWDAAAPKLLSTLPGSNAAGNFSADGKRLMTAWPDIKIWDIADPRAPVLIGTVGGYGVKCGGGFFPKRNWISVGGVTVRRFGFWDAESLEQIGTDMVLDHFPRCAAVSPDERLIAIGTMGATIELWDVASQSRAGILKGHGDAVYSLDFSPDGRTLASGSLDGTVKLWNMATRKLLLTLDDHDDQVRAVRFSPDGQYLVTGSVDGVILIRRAVRP